ncbi:hypothetical protein ACFLYH_00025 [Candidatus Dependentiae bacterium]
MFLLGVLSLIQIAFLPGFLLLRLFKLKLSLFITLIFSFALSLISNYVSIFFLTALGFYNRSVVYFTFCIELAFLLFLYFLEIKNLLNINIFSAIGNEIKSLFDDLNVIYKQKYSKYYYFYWIVIVFSLLSILWVFTFVLGNIVNLTTFIRCDSVVLWSKWSRDWFAGIFPKLTWHYPQLITANWSLAYKFLAEELQYFPKIIMPLFSTYLLILMFHLGICKKQLGYFVGVIATTLFLRHAFGGMIQSALIDLPLTFMSFLSIYCLLRSQDLSNYLEIKKYLILGMIFVCGAAVTKQMGLFVVCLYPLLTYLLVLRKKEGFFNSKQIFKLGFYFFIFGLIITAPFYLYKEWQIFHGFDSSEFSAIAIDQYQGKSLLGRFIYSTKIFLSYNVFFLNVVKEYYLHFTVGAILGLVYATMLFFSLFDPSYRVLFFLIFLPYAALWSLFCCYDMRNLAMAVPFYGLGLGIGLEKFLFFRDSYFYQRIKNFILNFKLYILLFLFLISLIFINFYYPITILLQRQRELSLQIFKPNLNAKLFKFNNKIGINKTVLTDYHFDRILALKNIPMQFQFLYHSTDGLGYAAKDSSNLGNYKKYCKNINNSEIGYILVSKNIKEDLKIDIDNKLKNKTYDLLFKKDGYRFIKIS